MMVKVTLTSLSEAPALPFGYVLDFESSGIEEALKVIDQVTAWASPHVTQEVSMEAGQSVEFKS